MTSFTRTVAGLAGDQINPTSTTDAALARYSHTDSRNFGPETILIRATLAVVTVALLIAYPAVVICCSTGLPASHGPTGAFRLLAVEAQWAVRAYA